MATDFFDFQLQVRAHTFYAGRDEFLSTDSRFTQWVCIAPEAGRFRYETETESGIERGEAQHGDLIFARPRGLFNRWALAPPLVYHVLQWSFLEQQSVVETAWRAGKWEIRDVARLHSTLAAFRALAGRADARGARLRAHLLEDLLHLCLAGEDAPPSDPLMSEAARLLTLRAGEMLAMSEISRAMGLSSVQFTRRFRSAFGCNPIEYLTRLRLENAQKMLVETPATLDQIAARCGWASGSYLIHVFEKHLQTTPGRFRALHRV